MPITLYVISPAGILSDYRDDVEAHPAPVLRALDDVIQLNRRVAQLAALPARVDVQLQLICGIHCLHNTRTLYAVPQ